MDVLQQPIRNIARQSPTLKRPITIVIKMEDNDAMAIILVRSSIFLNPCSFSPVCINFILDFVFFFFFSLVHKAMLILFVGVDYFLDHFPCLFHQRRSFGSNIGLLSPACYNILFRHLLFSYNYILPFVTFFQDRFCAIIFSNITAIKHTFSPVIYIGDPIDIPLSFCRRIILIFSFCKDCLSSSNVAGGLSIIQSMEVFKYFLYSCLAVSFSLNFISS